MALLEFAGAEVHPEVEWSYVEGAASRVTSDKMTGTGAMRADLTVANAVARYYGAGGVSPYNATVSGQGRKLWVAIAFKGARQFGTTEIPYGPIYQAYSSANQPAAFGTKAVAGPHYYLALYSAVLSELAVGTTDLSTGWYQLLTEWDDAAHTVTAWLWNGSAWVQELVYNYSPNNLWSSYAGFWGGYRSYKAGSLGCTPLTDDFCVISDYDSGDGCNTKPAEPPRIYGGHPISGTPTYNDFGGSPEGTNKYLNWDDGNSEPRNDDGDSSYNESGGAAVGPVRQTSELEDDVVGSDDILGVGFFQHYRVPTGNNGDIKHLIVADGAETEADLVVSSTYRSHAHFMAKTPAGNAWTESLLNGAEYGALRGFGGTIRRNLRSTMIWVEVAKGTLESGAPPPTGKKHYGWLY
jgi:hypothetical protein